MSKLATDFKIAVRNLTQHRRRTMLLGGALAAVTSLLVLLGALAAGIDEALVHTATTLASGHVNVGGFFKVTAGQSGPVVTDYEKVLPIVHQVVPASATVVQRGRGWAKVISATGSMQAGVNGIDITNEPRFKEVVKVTSGRIEDLAQPGTMLLFEDQLKKLDVKVGDVVTISAQTTRGVANTMDCRVVAIAHDVGLISKWNVYVPVETLRALYQINARSTGVIQVFLKDKDLPRVPQLAGQLRNALEKAGYRVMEADARAFWQKFEKVNREDWTGQKLDVTTWEDELSFTTWTRGLINGLTFVLLFILVAILVAGIMNTMWIAIRERTREIGTLRAIGMQRTGVLWMFMLEAMMLGLIGSGFGVVLGSAVAGALNAAHIPLPLAVQLFLMSDHLRLALQPGALARAIVLLTVVTGLAAILPSVRAARLRPVVAMSHFG